MDERFKSAEDQYFRLKGKLAAGRITREQFDAALKALMIQDAQGRYWILGADTGKWLVHDQHAWVEATPPTMGDGGKPTTLPEQPRLPKPSPAPSRAMNSKWILAFGGVAAVCVLLILGFTIAATQGIVNIGLAPVPSLAPPPPPESATPTVPAVVSSNVPGLRVSVIPAAAPASIAAKDFAALNTSLAEKIAALNQAQLKFIRDLRASSYHGRMPGLALPVLQKGSTLTDEDLKDLAGKAMDVAILADQLGEMSTKQDKGSSKAAQSAEPFFAIARNAFSLVVDAQNVR
ncbi:MAG: hypothetical protein KGJ80_09815, partial [Chloroflexota bacterium]|nr:hypothetical protein [Chloroflexota bacterium]